MTKKSSFIKPRLQKSGVIHRLYAKAMAQHRAMTATADDVDFRQPQQQKSAVTIVFFLIAIHLLVIAVWQVHSSYLRKDSDGKEYAGRPSLSFSKTELSESTSEYSFPQIKSTDKVHHVVQGETYAKIAQDYGISEVDLKNQNKNSPLHAGINIVIPPKKVVAEEPNEVKDIRKNSEEKPKSMLMKPNIPDQAPRAIIVPMEENHDATYIVKKGDTLYGIAQKFNTSTERLKILNGIKNDQSLRIGAKLTIKK